MAVRAGAPALAPLPSIPLHRRLYGFGSIYGKTIRDSRLAFTIAAGLLGGMSLVMGAGVSNVFPSPESRLEIDKLIGSMPESMIDLFGRPVGLGTLGGYFTWKYGAIFALGTSLWSILALSGTLAGEAGRGSLDLVASTPLGKRRVALEKLVAHLTVLALAMVVMAIACVVSSSLFGDAALGDSIPPLAATGYALWVGLLALLFGGVAFALAPLLGRSGAAGVAALVMMALWLANGFEALAPLATLSPFHWLSGHIALVGMYDWPAVAFTGLVAAVILGLGVELFVRRDLGVTAGLSLPGLPAAILGIRGSTSRAFGEQLPRALAWGIGLGLMGALVASMVATMADQLGNDSTLTRTISAIFPGFDVRSAGGWLQLYAQMLFIAAGFGAATFVSKWASDETAGRLETLLATPLSRARWAFSGGIAVLGSVVVMTALFAAGIGLGALSGNVDAREPVLGSAALGLYAAAVAGIGLAVGGIWRASLAAEVAALFVIATYLIDLVAPPLNLPDWVHQMALTAHLGQPMVGRWDPAGIGACLAIAGGGLLLGAWGMRRRDT